MSAGDDPPDTLPPPAGEEDAYSATTKVGVMPAELMAKLRAEGLLPEESEERRLQRERAQRPSAKSTLRSVPASPPTAPESVPPTSGNTKTITTAPPPAPDESTLVRRPSTSSQRPKAPELEPPGEVDDAPIVEMTTSDSSVPPELLSPEAVAREPHAAIETPVAFASPPWAASTPPSAAPSGAPSAGPSGVPSAAPLASAEPVGALAEPPKKSKFALVLLILAVLAAAFVMALMSQRR